MKIQLISPKVAPNIGTPMAFPDKQSGVDIPDMLVAQYENARVQYIAIRDEMIKAYNKAGGKL